jgi:hypothetical protein
VTVLSLTTAARVKAFLEVGGKSWTAADTLLTQLIPEVSAAFERHCGREFFLEERTRDFDVRPGQMVVQLPAWPITALTEVRNALDPDDFAEASSLVDSDDYVANTRLGIVEFYGPTLVSGPQVLRVKWTGGLAATDANLVAGYPDLALACEMQVAYLLQRRATLGANVQSGGGASMSFGEPGVDLLPDVLRKLAPYVRYR